MFKCPNGKACVTIAGLLRRKFCGNAQLQCGKVTFGFSCSQTSNVREYSAHVERAVPGLGEISGCRMAPSVWSLVPDS